MKLSIAELWMGVHPNGMSNVALSKESLADYIRHPSDPYCVLPTFCLYRGVYNATFYDWNGYAWEIKWKRCKVKRRNLHIKCVKCPEITSIWVMNSKKWSQRECYRNAQYIPLCIYVATVSGSFKFWYLRYRHFLDFYGIFFNTFCKWE